MIPTYRQPVIQIDITNACNLECSNCTRFVGHHKKPYLMDIEMVEKAILSLTTPFSTPWQDFPKGFSGQIGIMGGEPTIHSKFAEICKLMQTHVTREKRSLWTDGARYKKSSKRLSIMRTFFTTTTPTLQSAGINHFWLPPTSAWKIMH